MGFTHMLPAGSWALWLWHSWFLTNKKTYMLHVINQWFFKRSNTTWNKMFGLFTEHAYIEYKYSISPNFLSLTFIHCLLPPTKKETKIPKIHFRILLVWFWGEGEKFQRSHRAKVLKVQPVDRHRISPRNCSKQHLRTDDSPQGGGGGLLLLLLLLLVVVVVVVVDDRIFFGHFRSDCCVVFVLTYDILSLIGVIFWSDLVKLWSLFNSNQSRPSFSNGFWDNVPNLNKSAHTSITRYSTALNSGGKEIPNIWIQQHIVGKQW